MSSLRNSRASLRSSPAKPSRSLRLNSAEAVADPVDPAAAELADAVGRVAVPAADAPSADRRKGTSLDYRNALSPLRGTSFPRSGAHAAFGSHFFWSALGEVQVLEASGVAANPETWLRARGYY